LLRLRIFLLGAILFVIGIPVAWSFWSVGALMDVECRAHWDDRPACRAVITRAWTETAIPPLGLALMIGSGIAELRANRRR
jgi:hypothetical protein